MNLLQIPIKDKFYFPPSDPAAQSRATEFAQEKGLLNQHKAVPLGKHEDYSDVFRKQCCV